MNKICKKVVVITLFACMVMGVLTGCGDKKEKTSEIVGTWKAASVEAAGVSVDFAQYAEQLGQEADSIKMEMEVKEDKTFSMDMMGQTADGTWEEKDGKYILTSEGVDQEVTIADGKMNFSVEEADMKVTFEKK